MHRNSDEHGQKNATILFKMATRDKNWQRRQKRVNLDKTTANQKTYW
jgi:hypothetical protein